MNKKVVVAGHICLDITPAFPEKSVRQIGDILQPGKLIHVDGTAASIGGVVPNTGLAMKLFGCDVRLIGKTGKDAFGTVILDALRAHDADGSIILSDQSSTSFTIALAVPGIDRIFLHSPGANDDFSSEDITDDQVKDAALFHFGYPPLMRRMYEDDGVELTKIFERVHGMGVATSLDLAAVDPESPAGRANWETILANTLPFTDIFVPSVEELLYMYSRDRYNTLCSEAAGRDLTELVTMEDLRKLGSRALDAGAKIVLIKCGAQGLYFRTASGKAMEDFCSKMGLDASWCGRESFEVSYLQENILSGTGAGDTCIGAFLSMILRQEKPEDALHLAAAAGALCISAYDALSGLKTLDEMKKMIDDGWPKADRRLPSA